MSVIVKKAVIVKTNEIVSIYLDDSNPKIIKIFYHGKLYTRGIDSIGKTILLISEKKATEKKPNISEKRYYGRKVQPGDCVEITNYVTYEVNVYKILEPINKYNYYRMGGAYHGAKTKMKQIYINSTEKNVIGIRPDSLMAKRLLNRRVGYSFLIHNSNGSVSEYKITKIY